MAKIKDDKNLIIPIHSTIAVLAPPSSGKGRFCRGVSANAKILHVETGQLLRQTNDEYIHGIMEAGELIDDKVVLGLTKNHIKTNFERRRHNFLFLDGFPRNPDQVECLSHLAIGRIYIVQLKIHDNLVRRRFLNSLDNDPERKTRPDNSMKAFEKRLTEFRKFEPKILAHAHAMHITVFKREISNTDRAAEEFHRIHIVGRRNLRPEGAHPHHH